MSYRWADDPELTEAERNEPNTVLLALKDYQEGSNITHGFFSTMAPEDIFNHLLLKLSEQGQAYTVSEKTWTLKFTIRKELN